MSLVPRSSAEAELAQLIDGLSIIHSPLWSLPPVVVLNDEKWTPAPRQNRQTSTPPWGGQPPQSLPSRLHYSHAYLAHVPACTTHRAPQQYRSGSALLRVCLPGRVNYHRRIVVYN